MKSVKDLTLKLQSLFNQWPFSSLLKSEAKCQIIKTQHFYMMSHKHLLDSGYLCKMQPLITVVFGEFLGVTMENCIKGIKS